MEALRRAKEGERVELTWLPAASYRSLSRALLSQDFHLIHLSCHGQAGGLLMEGHGGEDHGNARMFMTAADLSELLSEYAQPRGVLECLLVNACNSAALEPFVAPVVPTTVLMAGAVDDRAALHFSEGFYDALGAGRSLTFAYREGRRRARVLASAASLEARLSARLLPRRPEAV